MSLEESASGITPKNVLIPPIRIDVPKGVKIGLIYIYIYTISNVKAVRRTIVYFVHKLV